jgi:prepilin signal peptidase PulO-like enzyme (type II secretory pathway)
MSSLFFIFAFILGLLVGSFINCVVYRLHQGVSFLSGRSFCPHCKKSIRWYDNIPLISYLLLHGHCRACQKKISPTYPLVELAGGVLFLLAALHIYPVLLAAGYKLPLATTLTIIRDWLFAGILLVIFLYDLKYYLVLDTVVLPAVALALVFNLVIAALENNSLGFLISRFLNFSISALLAGGFFLFLFLISKGKWIGGGDIRLGLLLGMLLGWPDVLVALFLAYVSGALIGVFLIALKKKTMASAVPFGTFLTASAFIVLLWGPWLIEKYLSLDKNRLLSGLK